MVQLNFLVTKSSVRPVILVNPLETFLYRYRTKWELVNLVLETPIPGPCH